MTKVRIKNLFIKLILILMSLFIGICFLVLIFLSILQIPQVKNHIAQEGLSYLNQDFKTQIQAKKIDISFFGNLELHEVKIKDEHKYNFIKIEKLSASINFFKLIFSDFNTIKFNQITLYKPNIQVITYKGENQDNFTLFIDKFDDGKKPTKESTFQFLSEIDILNGKLSIINQNLEDSIWLDANDLNISANNLKTKGNHVFINIIKFNFKAKKHQENYELKQLSTQFSYSKKGMKFENLLLETQNSSLNGNLEFKYKDPEKLQDFNNKVNWILDINPTSILSGKDIRYFSKNWDSNAEYKIEAYILGSLNNLVLNKMQLSSKNNFFKADELDLKKVIDGKFQIDAKKLKLQTSNSDLKTILPSFIAKKLKNYADPLEKINYNGDLSINQKELNLKGNLVSALGIADVNLKMKDYLENNPIYEAKIKTNQFNISSLIGDKTVQNFSGEFEISGKSFTPKNLSSNFKAKINEINILSYKLKDLFLDGEIKNQIFTGLINSFSNLAKFKSNSIIDFSSKKIKIDTKTNIEHLDLFENKLSTVKGEFITTNLEGKIEFSSLDDINIDAKVSDFILNSPVNSITFNNLFLKTYLTENGRYLNIDSPSNIKLVIDGKYNLQNLPSTFMNGIGGIMVGYQPHKESKNENFTFDLEISDSFLELFVKDISFDFGTKLNGSYSGLENEFDLHLNSPKFSYKNMSSENLSLELNTSNRNKNLNINTNVFSISNKFIRNISIKTENRNDSLLVNTQFFIDKDLKSPFKLNLYEIKNKQELIFGFLSSDFVINNTKWKINEQNNSDINFGIYNLKTGKFILNDLIINSGQAEMKLNGDYQNMNNLHLLADFKDVYLDKLIPQEKLGDITIKGLANGKIDILKNENDIQPIADFNIQDLTLNDFNLGNLNTNIKFDEQEKNLIIDTELRNNDELNLSLKGKINKIIKDPTINFEAEFDNFKTNFLGGFLKGVLSDVKGVANGKININGKLDNPNYDGFLMLSKFGFKVDYLGVNYRFNDEQELKIYSLNKNPNNLGNIYIDQADFYSLDSNEKRHGSVSGIIQTTDFSKWFVNLDFDSEDLMVLNTTPKQNELFYGKVFAKGTFSLYGFVDKLAISADAKALKSSTLILNTSATTISDDENKILIFKKNEDFTKNQVVKTKQNLGLSIDFKIAVDESTQIKVILDETSGDEITAHGSSPSIRFQMFPNGNISMNGKYEVKQGSKYHFKTLLDKVFTIETGSTINWTGNPYDADLNIVASITKQVSNAGDFLKMSNIPVIPVDLKINIIGKLSEPQIDFDVKAPKAPQAVKEELDLKFDKNPELEKNQFGVVLLTSKFYTDNSSSISGVSSSAYEVAMRQLVNFLNNISPDIQFDLGVTESDQLSNTSGRVNTGINLNLNPRIKVKSSVGIPIGGSISGNNQVIAEGEVEYDISKRNDNSLIVRAFSRPTSFGLENYNVGVSQLQSYGAGFVYRKSFNTLRGFLGLKPKIKNQKNEKNDSIIINE